MASKTISEEAKRACVIRVAAARKGGKNIVPGEAKRLNVSVQAIRNWCREAGVDLKGEVAPPSPAAAAGSSPAGTAAPSPAAPAPASTAAEDLADAHKIAGTDAPAAPAAAGPVTAAEVQKAYVEASAEDKEFVVGTLEDFKKMAVGMVGPMVFKIPQEHPGLQKIAAFGPMTRNILRANAGIIAPDMRATIARGWDIVLAAVAMDLTFTTGALMDIKKSLKPKREEEETEERPARAARREEPAEEPAPAAAPAGGGIWKPGDGVPPPPPPGSVVTR